MIVSQLRERTIPPFKDITHISNSRNNKPKPDTYVGDSSHALINEILEEFYDEGDLLYSTN